MVRHIVMWKYAGGFTYHQNHFNAVRIKTELEKLKDIIDGIISIEVIIDPLASSDKDIILNSLFENQEALQKYQAHPEHLKIGNYVKSVTKDRVCVDFIE